MMGRDEFFAPARRALIYGPLLCAAGVALIVLGAVGVLPWWVMIVGGVLALLFLLRTIAAGAILLFERNRQRLLRSGTPGTATIRSAEQVRTHMGFPIFKLVFDVEAPGAEREVVERTAAVPAQYAGELVPGAEIPARLDSGLSEPRRVRLERALAGKKAHMPDGTTIDPPKGVPEAELDRIFRGPLEEFTAARNELAKELRDNDAKAAEWVKGLKKPTRAAWLVNQLGQRKRSSVVRLLDLGEELRGLQEELLAGSVDRDKLRKAAGREQKAIDELVKTAEAIGREHKVGAPVIERVTETLQAASADPEVAAGDREGPAPARGAGERARRGRRRGGGAAAPRQGEEGSGLMQQPAAPATRSHAAGRRPSASSRGPSSG